MLKTYLSIALHVAVILCVALALYATIDWPSETALFPRFIGIPILGLSIVSLVLEVRRHWSAVSSDAELADEEKSVTYEQGQSALIELAWLAGFAVGIWALGFYVTSFVFLSLRLLIQAKWSTVSSLVWAAFVVGLLFGMFELVLVTTPYQGFIWRMLL